MPCTDVGQQCWYVRSRECDAVRGATAHYDGAILCDVMTVRLPILIAVRLVLLDHEVRDVVVGCVVILGLLEVRDQLHCHIDRGVNGGGMLFRR